jgi:hypothetical protein
MSKSGIKPYKMKHFQIENSPNSQDWARVGLDNRCSKKNIYTILLKDINPHPEVGIKDNHLDKEPPLPLSDLHSHQTVTG